ncbi:hypothetical protein HWV62_26933 [Athelia sp. TMB]|nr:hypothetical protein HWV62_26933 [Athelia sp. TMB]
MHDLEQIAPADFVYILQGGASRSKTTAPISRAQEAILKRWRSSRRAGLSLVALAETEAGSSRLRKWRGAEWTRARGDGEGAEEASKYSAVPAPNYAGELNIRSGTGHHLPRTLPAGQGIVPAAALMGNLSAVPRMRKRSSCRCLALAYLAQHTHDGQQVALQSIANKPNVYGAVVDVQGKPAAAHPHTNHDCPSPYSALACGQRPWAAPCTLQLRGRGEPARRAQGARSSSELADRARGAAASRNMSQLLKGNGGPEGCRAQDIHVPHLFHDMGTPRLQCVYGSAVCPCAKARCDPGGLSHESRQAAVGCIASLLGVGGDAQAPPLRFIESYGNKKHNA